MKAAMPDRDPRRLEAGEALGVGPSLVEPDDEHVPEAVEQTGDRQERAVGVRREPADRDVGGELQPEHHREEGPDVGGDRGVLGERGEEVGTDGDEGAERR